MKFIVHIDDDLIEHAKKQYDLINDEYAAGVVLQRKYWWDIDNEVKIVSLYQPKTKQ